VRRHSELSSLSFGAIALGLSSASQTVTVTNASTSAVTVNSVGFTGDFSDATTCVSFIAAGGSCTASVTFTPTAVGTRTGTLNVNLSTGVLSVPLSGIGSSSSQTGVLSFSPSTLTFPGYTIGDNPSKTVTVSNTSGASVGIAEISLSGDASLTEKTKCGATLAEGSTCSITVTFQPVAYGTFTGALSLAESSGSRDAVSVTGQAPVPLTTKLVIPVPTSPGALAPRLVAS
jgi:hypothetical protein